jgi:hypothetical protein
VREKLRRILGPHGDTARSRSRESLNQGTETPFEGGPRR